LTTALTHFLILVAVRFASLVLGLLLVTLGFLLGAARFALFLCQGGALFAGANLIALLLTRLLTNELGAHAGILLLDLLPSLIAGLGLHLVAIGCRGGDVLSPSRRCRGETAYDRHSHSVRFHDVLRQLLE